MATSSSARPGMSETCAYTNVLCRILIYCFVPLRLRITLLGIAQNLAHDAATQTPKSLLLRARKLHRIFIMNMFLADVRLETDRLSPVETRKTYRAILSEPTLIMPSVPAPSSAAPVARSVEAESPSRANGDISHESNEQALGKAAIAPVQDLEETDANTAKTRQTRSNAKKRAIGDLDENDATTPVSIEATPSDGPVKKRRKRGKAKVAESNAS